MEIFDTAHVGVRIVGYRVEIYPGQPVRFIVDTKDINGREVSWPLSLEVEEVAKKQLRERSE